MKSVLPALLLPLLLSAAFAAPPSVSVKQIGATFLEAPPGREKNLTPIGTGSFGAQEYVETHVVVAFKDRIIADIPAFNADDTKVTVTAILPNKTQSAMGNARSSSFRKVSEDGKKTLVSLSINRLPDGGATGISFNGTIKLPVATSLARTTVVFQPKVGTKVDIGLGDSVVSNVDATSLTLSGDERLMGLAGIKLIKADGTTLTGERVATPGKAALMAPKLPPNGASVAPSARANWKYRPIES